jgi:molecular chaperone GrpE
MTADRKRDENAVESEAQPPEQAQDTPEVATDEAFASEEITVEQLQAKADENWEKYVRAVAELDNVRKRAARDVENAHKFALERFGKDLLAVKDSLEMGLAVENADVEALREGSLATLKMLGSTLERFGIAEIHPEGEPFDPEFHEAMTMQPAPDAEPGSVLNVVQKGYTLNGRLLRPAMVVVAAEA